MAKSLPETILDALPLVTGNDEHGLSERTISEFRDRRQGYDLVHLGHTSTTIGDVQELVERTGDLCPPRSGHVGSWDAIASGRAGALDFNGAICGRKYGYPLIYAFTTTESESGGDTVYRPGTDYADGVGKRLPLATWDGSRFIHRPDPEPLFVPFAVVDSSQRRTLVAHHRESMERTGLGIRFEADAVIHAEDLTRKILSQLVKDALRSTNPGKALGEVAPRAVTPSAKVSTANIEVEGTTIRFCGTRFSDADEFVEAALDVFRATSRPEWFLENAGHLPENLPLLSATVSGILSAVIGTHLTMESPRDRSAHSTPFTPHIHWGARHMAGIPPRDHGYLFRQSSRRQHRRLMESLVAGVPEIDPVLMILAPAVVFSLCPTHPEDLAPIQVLIDRALGIDHIPNVWQLGNPGAKMVATWIDEFGGRLSAEFWSRFPPNAGSGQVPAGPPRSWIEPIGFKDLTFRGACAIVGELRQSLIETS